MDVKAFFLFSILLVYGFSVAADENNSSLGIEESETRVLSRKKRFLIFPDGSSFQLVFETQNMGYLQVGDVVWFSNTAALAWELPTDPNIFYLFKNKDKLYGGQNLRRKDNKHIIFYDEEGKVILTKPYKKKTIVNPIFGKRSIESEEERKKLVEETIKKMHEDHEKRDIIKELDSLSTEFHRNGRKGFYDKFEKFLEGLGWNGKECVLRLLCEMSKAEKKQGTFLEEIIRATFTFPKSLYIHESHKDYDAATSTEEACAKLYPECENLDQ